MTHHQTITVVLAGGKGSRLHPLTEDRAKPAVPFGGKYRIIDLTLSNCLHSGLRRVLVLTQYKSHSLEKHLRDAWSVFDSSLGEYITAVGPQMRVGDSWYAGTADAIYQNLYLLSRSGASQALILSGDHIYRMDYAAMLRFHAQREAAVTIACLDVPLEVAGQFGVLVVDRDMRVVDFDEKPSFPRPMSHRSDRALVSMGVYIFSIEVLKRVLANDHLRATSSHDFGRDILPRLIAEGNAFAYRFGGHEGRVSRDHYWRDVGTIDSYFEANMDLLSAEPPVDLYQENWPIRTAVLQCPPARTVPGDSGFEAELTNCILSDGAVVRGAAVRHTILSPGVRVENGALVDESLLFEGVRIGEGARLRRTIVDKHVHVPAGEIIGFDERRDRQRFPVSESGIVVVPKGFQFAAQETRENGQMTARV